jgi:hypothetical protein
LAICAVVYENFLAQTSLTSAQEYPMVTQGTKSLQEAIDDGTIQPKQWYWTERTPSVNITRMALQGYLPLLERGKYNVIDIRDYFKPQYEGAPWLGVMLDHINLADKEKGMVLIRTVSLLHRPSTVSYDDAVFQFLTALPKESSISMFKKVGNRLIRLDYKDIPFLNEYYIVENIKDKSELIEHSIKKYNVTATEWSMYEYYKSGRLFRITKVGIAPGSIQNTQYRHLPNYAMTVTEYDDVDKPERRVYSTPFHDVNHKLWLPKILHN